MLRALLLVFVIGSPVLAAQIWDQSYWTARQDYFAPSVSVGLTAFLPKEDQIGHGSMSMDSISGTLEGTVALDGNVFSSGPLRADILLRGSRRGPRFEAWVPGTTTHESFQVGLSVDATTSWEQSNRVDYVLAPAPSGAWYPASKAPEPVVSERASVPITWWIQGPTTRLEGTGTLIVDPGEPTVLYLPNANGDNLPSFVSNPIGRLGEPVSVWEGTIDGVPMRVQADIYSSFWLVPEPSAFLLSTIGLLILTTRRRAVA